MLPQKDFAKATVFKSITVVGHALGIKAGSEIPGCKESICWILLIALRSDNTLHFLDFFSMTNKENSKGWWTLLYIVP